MELDLVVLESVGLDFLTFGCYGGLGGLGIIVVVDEIAIG